MKKIVAFLLVAVCLSLSFGCMAEFCTVGEQTFEFFNRFDGNGVEISAFQVRVYSSHTGSITFQQQKGIAVERSVFNWLTDDNQEWGKYHIYYMLEGGCVEMEDWDDSFHSDEYTLYLKNNGLYTVWVVPFTNEEINDSYLVDHFENWKKAPYWNIKTANYCTYLLFEKKPLTKNDIVFY